MDKIFLIEKFQVERLLKQLRGSFKTQLAIPSSSGGPIVPNNDHGPEQSVNRQFSFEVARNKNWVYRVLLSVLLKC